MSSASSPQHEQMADESMVRCLRAQIEAIWPHESPLLAAYDLPESLDILDLGCGTGEVSSRIARQFPGASVTGVDLVSSHLELARDRCADLGERVRFVEDDAMALSLEDDSFDLCISRHLLQAVPDTATVLAELKRVTRPGGRLHLLAEDYGMIHFHHPNVDIDRFWREGPWRLGEIINTDLRSGRKVYGMLRRLGTDEISVTTLPVDSINTDREVLYRIFESWRDGYTEVIIEQTDLSRDKCTEGFAAILECIRDPEAYVLWQIPIISALVPAA